MAEDNKKKSSGKDYPMYPNYGKITRYQDYPSRFRNNANFANPV